MTRYTRISIKTMINIIAVASRRRGVVANIIFIDTHTHRLFSRTKNGKSLRVVDLLPSLCTTKPSLRAIDRAHITVENFVVKGFFRYLFCDFIVFTMYFVKQLTWLWTIKLLEFVKLIHVLKYFTVFYSTPMDKDMCRNASRDDHWFILLWY